MNETQSYEIKLYRVTAPDPRTPGAEHSWWALSPSWLEGDRHVIALRFHADSPVHISQVPMMHAAYVVRIDDREYDANLIALACAADHLGCMIEDEDVWDEWRKLTAYM